MSAILESPAPSTQPSDQPATAAAPAVTTPEQAVDKCVQAYQRAYSASAAKGEHSSRCRVDGAHAFRLAMPSTGSLAEVHAFIACIIRGMHLEIWICHQERDLLAAARIAIAAHRCESQKKKIVG